MSFLTLQLFYSDKPSSPCNLQVVEVCKDYVFVKWQAPMSDGNSPITRYVVEKADARTPNFTTACHTDCDTLEVKVSQLNKGKHYFLRVFAENVIGRSEPVSLQEPVRLPLGECVTLVMCCCVNFFMLINRYVCTHDDMIMASIISLPRYKLEYAYCKTLI